MSLSCPRAIAYTSSTSQDRIETYIRAREVMLTTEDVQSLDAAGDVDRRVT